MLRAEGAHAWRAGKRGINAGLIAIGSSKSLKACRGLNVSLKIGSEINRTEIRHDSAPASSVAVRRVIKINSEICREKEINA